MFLYNYIISKRKEIGSCILEKDLEQQLKGRGVGVGRRSDEMASAYVFPSFALDQPIIS